MALGISAGTWLGAGTAILGGFLGKSGADSQANATRDANQAQIDANKVDPRITDMLFGNGQRTLKPGVTPTYAQSGTHSGRLNPFTGEYEGATGPGGSGQMTNPDSDYTTNSGLLGRFQGMLDQPQSASMQNYGAATGGYLDAHTAGDMGAMHDRATQLMGQQLGAPQMTAATAAAPAAMQAATIGGPSSMTAAHITAPNQNGIDLTGAYNRTINGDAGANPYLTGAIQGGINQSSNAFGNMLQSAQRSLTENILPGIRSGAHVSGSYGGNREGLAEGNAINDFSTQMGQAASQFGQHNTDAAVGAQAGAYSQGQDRALSAMSGLGAQQYGVAGQNANFQQQANETTYQGNLQRAMQQAQFQQQAGQTNYQGDLQRNLANAGFQQGANQNNQQSQISTHAMNIGSQEAGLGAMGGLLGTAQAGAQNQDQYGINRATQVNGLLQPYLSKNPVPTQLQPVYNNTGSSLLGGAMAGLGLYNQFKGGGTPSAISTYGSYGPFGPSGG